MEPVRILLLGAHPDDAEFFAGGFLAKHASLGSKLRLISVTDGRSGHQSIPDEKLISIRRQEAAQSGHAIGAEYLTWDFPDGYLTPSQEVRHRIIAEIRSFQPDLVLTHRTCDYHPDHRAVAQAVQDASYLVTVPKIVAEVPALRRDPIVAYMVDLFTRPVPLRADFVFDATPFLDKVVDMLACHTSQVFDWLPYNQCVLDQVPAKNPKRRAWLQDWFLGMAQPRQRFWQAAWGRVPELIEAFEISEYAGRLSQEQKDRLFPGCKSST